MRPPGYRLWIAALCFGGGSSLQAQLEGQWLFDEGSGTVYADSSPNGNDAFTETFTGWSTEVPTTGFANPASIEFNGFSSYASTEFAGIEGDAPRTVAVWIRSTAAASNHGIVAWGDSTVNGAKWHLRINNSAANGPQGGFRVETQGDYMIGSTFIADGQWHHLVCVYAGGGELGTTRLFVDGVEETVISNNPSVQPVNTALGVDDVSVGRRNQGGTLGYFPGSVDDVRIYDRALTDQEVVDLTRPTPTTDGLVMHLPLDEGSGLTSADLGTGNNDATLFPQNGNAPTWSTDAPPPLSNSLEFVGGDILNDTGKI